MDAIKKLPPSRRFIKYHPKPSKSPTRKLSNVNPKSDSGRISAKNASPETSKSQIKTKNKVTAKPQATLKSPEKTKPNQKSLKSKKLENTCPEDDPLVAPRMSYSFSEIQKAGDNKQIISFSLCHGLKLAVPPKMDDSKFDLCSRVGSKHKAGFQVDAQLVSGPFSKRSVLIR